MKKMFFIAAMTGAALVGCTKNEVAPSVPAPQEITFATPVVGVQTKAQYGEVGVNYNVNEHFGVYAVHSAGDLATWAAGTLYMGTLTTGLEVMKTGSENYWAPATPYYWPKEGKLSFAAYSPFDVTGTVAYDAAGLSVTGHTVSANTAEHVDFMYAPRVYNRNSSTEEGDDNNSVYKYAGVNILFKHAMSSIVFKVARKTGIDANTVITLKDITITKPYMKADFKETVTDGSSYVAAPAWSNWSENSADLVTYSGTVALDETLTEYVNNTDDDVILIPQTLSADVDVLLDYTITTPGGHVVEQQSKIDLDTYTPAWGMGTRYTYNITIGLEEIIFDPAVTDWANAADTPIAL